MTEIELFERCKAVLGDDVSDIRWCSELPVGCWVQRGVLCTKRDIDAILCGRLAEKVREKWKDAHAYWNKAFEWMAICNGGSACADSELAAWLALAEKVCKPAETLAKSRARTQWYCNKCDHVFTDLPEDGLHNGCKYSAAKTATFHDELVAETPAPKVRCWAAVRRDRFAFGVAWSDKPVTLCDGSFRFDTNHAVANMTWCSESIPRIHDGMKPGEIREIVEDVPTPTIDAEFEAECRELWRRHLQPGSSVEADWAVKQYRARFGPKTGGGDAK